MTRINIYDDVEALLQDKAEEYNMTVAEIIETLVLNFIDEIEA